MQNNQTEAPSMDGLTITLNAQTSAMVRAWVTEIEAHPDDVANGLLEYIGGGALEHYREDKEHNQAGEPGLNREQSADTLAAMKQAAKLREKARARQLAAHFEVLDREELDYGDTMREIKSIAVEECDRETLRALSKIQCFVESKRRERWKDADEEADQITLNIIRCSGVATLEGGIAEMSQGEVTLPPRLARRLALYAEANGCDLEGMIVEAIRFTVEQEYEGHLHTPAVLSLEDGPLY